MVYLSDHGIYAEGDIMEEILDGGCSYMLEERDHHAYIRNASNIVLI